MVTNLIYASECKTRWGLGGTVINIGSGGFWVLADNTDAATGAVKGNIMLHAVGINE